MADTTENDPIVRIVEIEQVRKLPMLGTVATPANRLRVGVETATRQFDLYLSADAARELAEQIAKFGQTRDSP